MIMLKWIKERDWLIRTLKTFVATVGGVLVPEIAIILNNGFPENFEMFWVMIAPFVAGALSAGITAVWNIILERLKTDTKG